jgi:hypothetical protein
MAASTDALGGIVTKTATVALSVFVLGTVLSAQVPLVQHVFIVVEENQDFSCVIGNPSMKYLNDELAAKYGVATSYYANSHPSISNYFVLTTGQTIYRGLIGDTRTDPIDIDNVIRELKKNGKSWRAYVEGVPRQGYTGGNIAKTHYVKRHNPLAYFEKDISIPERANLALFSQFADDLARQSLANYSFLVPDLFDDGHDVKGTDGSDQGRAKCGDPTALKQADDWLRNNIAPLVSSAVFKDKGLLVVVFDEASNGDKSDGAGRAEGGGRVPMILIGSKVKPAYRSAVLYHHESVLRLMLEALGLDRANWPGAAKDAPSMAEFFSQAP